MEKYDVSSPVIQLLAFFSVWLLLCEACKSDAGEDVAPFCFLCSFWLGVTVALMAVRYKPPSKTGDGASRRGVAHARGGGGRGGGVLVGFVVCCLVFANESVAL